MKRLFIAAIALLTMASSVNAQTRHRVIRVVDGDTIKVDYQGKPTDVRLRCADTPETWQTKDPNQLYWGEVATWAVEQIVQPGHYVRLQITDRGRYGRPIAIVYTDQGGEINYWLVLQGLAAVDPDYRDGCEVYEQAQQRARSLGSGMWGKLERMPWEDRDSRR